VLCFSGQALSLGFTLVTPNERESAKIEDLPCENWLVKPVPPHQRKACLAAAITICYLRVLITLFVFLKRGVGWSELPTVAPWLLVISAWYSRSPAGRMPRVSKSPVWPVSSSSSWGLFRYSRHPNYVGDLIPFSGIGMIAGVWITALIPAAMLAGFVFVNIPILDSHLRDHYGAACDEYAGRTRKLIPFVY
jgi:protein-S-isoprenylcysteine O-methyltransferase Ste14